MLRDRSVSTGGKNGPGKKQNRSPASIRAGSINAGEY